MFKASWMRLASPALLAIGLSVLLPSLAQAQLFPNRTIRRERPPCSSEPPFNAQVRRDYFGYYPTCWTRFPAGWACPCPNPELPNLADSISRNGPIGRSRTPVEGDPRPGLDEEGQDRMGDPKPANPAGDNPDLPLPNQGRSPFDIDPSPRPNLDNPATSPRPPAPGPGTGRPTGPTGLMDMPKLPETAPTTGYVSPLQPGSMAVAPEATLASSDTSDLRPDLGPLPAAPAPAQAPSVSIASATPETLPTVGMPAPAQAPRRKGFLSSLFNKNGQNR